MEHTQHTTFRKHTKHEKYITKGKHTRDVAHTNQQIKNTQKTHNINT